METTNVNPILALRSCFKGVTEYRKPQGKTYDLEDLLAASILAILSGADGFTSMSEYCKDKFVFLQKYGKALRATREGGKKTSAIYIVSAWASENGICLGQSKVNKKSNEKTAIPKLLKALDIEGCIVTIDAMGAHPPIAKNIVDKKADYILALKKTTKISTSK